MATARAPGREEVRCPSCSRLLVLRTGPAITPHFAHRPRQSCRRRPGPAGISPLRLEQLTLFDSAEFNPPEPRPAPRVAGPQAGPACSVERSRPRRRRRRAWLPRLVRWMKSHGPAFLGLHP